MAKRKKLAPPERRLCDAYGMVATEFQGRYGAASAALRVTNMAGHVMCWGGAVELECANCGACARIVQVEGGFELDGVAAGQPCPNGRR